MLVFAREVFVCRCSTRVRPGADPGATEVGRRARFRRGTHEDLDRVDPAYHTGEHVDELRERLDRGEYWLVGEVDAAIVAYTWLHDRDRAGYPSLPGCEVMLRDDTGYGYDAWTSPAFRGHGLRRIGFVEELLVLNGWGIAWEASFFVAHQLQGATRSLATVGIEVEPLWRVWLDRRRSLGAERLHADADAARPAWLSC